MPQLQRTLLALSLTFAAPAALAQAQASPEVCAPTAEVDRYQLLRQLSLDLRGRIPTIEEYEALEQVGDVDEASLGAMLMSDDFLAQMRRYHASLILPTLEGVEYLVPLQRILFVADPGTDAERWWAPIASTLYRGTPDLPCLDQEQTSFDADGHPVPLVTDAGLGPACPASGCTQEGWVMIEPYWAPGSQVKVCAYEAQAQALGSTIDLPFLGTIGPIDCTGPTGSQDPKCGCGPQLERCTSQDFRNVVQAITERDLSLLGTDARLRQELAEEPLRILEAVIREGRPYFDALTTDETYLTGATAHYYRAMHAQGFGDDILRETPYAAGMGALPDLPFADREWHAHTRSSEHSGILTTFGYMLRYNSNRGRANRFYDRFLCKPFSAPAGGLPPSTDACSSEPDLSERCGCASCHATLEPAAAYFGRWEHTRRFGYMETSDFPDFDPVCEVCTGGACPAECSLYYVTPDVTLTAEEEAWHGELTSLQWRDDAEAEALLAGPEGLVEQGLESGELARCTVQNLAEYLLKRPLTPAEVLGWVPELAQDFAASDHDFRALVRTLVSHEAYRRVE